jgi:hypothetical protein
MRDKSFDNGRSDWMKRWILLFVTAGLVCIALLCVYSATFGCYASQEAEEKIIEVRHYESLGFRQDIYLTESGKVFNMRTSAWDTPLLKVGDSYRLRFVGLDSPSLGLHPWARDFAPAT